MGASFLLLLMVALTRCRWMHPNRRCIQQSCLLNIKFSQYCHRGLGCSTMCFASSWGQTTLVPYHSYWQRSKGVRSVLLIFALEQEHGVSFTAPSRIFASMMS